MERRKKGSATREPNTRRCKKCHSQRTSDLQFPENRSPLHRHYHQYQGFVTAPSFLLSEVDCKAISKKTKKPLTVLAYAKNRQTNLDLDER